MNGFAEESPTAATPHLFSLGDLTVGRTFNNFPGVAGS